jgi:hypothetical protein
MSLFVGVGSVEAKSYASTAEFLDAEILVPRHSVITGQMMMNVEKWYGIPVLAQLVILGAESSLGKPPTPCDIGGGALVKANNFGCMRFGSRETKWGMLAEPTAVHVAGRDWFQFKTPAIGMCAWGRLMKEGPSGNPGFYRSIVQNRPFDWSKFARVYYGANVAGLGEYVWSLRALETSFKTLGLKYGFNM